jgi:hypothetical protein
MYTAYEINVHDIAFFKCHDTCFINFSNLMKIYTLKKKKKEKKKERKPMF